MMAGLAALPNEPVEAAKILGASKWAIFVEIQLPLLRPVIVLALILRFLAKSVNSHKLKFYGRVFVQRIILTSTDYWKDDL